MHYCYQRLIFVVDLLTRLLLFSLSQYVDWRKWWHIATGENSLLCGLLVGFVRHIVLTFTYRTVHINVSVHTIIGNIHLLVTYAILPVRYCTDAPLRRYATLRVVRCLSGGWAKWFVDANLAARQKKNYFITSAVRIPKMICNTWLNGWCNEVYILSTGVAAFHYFCTWRDYCVAINRFALDTYYGDSRYEEGHAAPYPRRATCLVVNWLY